MPRISKKLLSQFVRTGCQRRLRFDLYPEVKRDQILVEERKRQNIPSEDVRRGGLHLVAKEGRRWEREVYDDLEGTLGSSLVLAQRDPKGIVVEQDFLQAIKTRSQEQFYIEAEFDISNTFISAHGIHDFESKILALRGDKLTFSRLRPDIIQIVPPHPQSSQYSIDVHGDRNEIASNDVRIRLRVIDVKHTAEPSPAYFAEVAFYSMALAGWLEDMNLSDQYLTLYDGAVWSGTHNGSAVNREKTRIETEEERPATVDEILVAMNDDLEFIPEYVFTHRIRRFFQSDIEAALAPKEWQNLDWHVTNRCNGCDYLGFPWDGKVLDERHCWPAAQAEGHLCRVFGITQGCRQSLQTNGVNSVEDLSQLKSTDKAFDQHQMLQVGRAILPQRAQSLIDGHAELPNYTGGTAALPSHADLKAFINVEFDVSSGITLSIAWRVVWFETIDGVDKPQYRENIQVVRKKNLEDECSTLLTAFRTLNSILHERIEKFPGHGRPTFQVFVWDRVAADHLVRIFGRHLSTLLTDPGVGGLPWLFPPEEALPDHRYVKRRSPLCLVQDVARSHVVAGVPHYYSLLNLARQYYPDNMPENIRRFYVPNQFQDVLSDHVPSERAHEVWTEYEGKNYDYQQVEESLRVTVRSKLRALDSVVRKLQADLKGRLRTQAPAISSLTPQSIPNISWDSKIWFEFARLNKFLDEYEVDVIRAYPAHEREAKFYSVRSEWFLQGQDRQKALERMGLEKLIEIEHVFVLKMRPQSRDAKIKDGEFTWSLMPELNLDISYKRPGKDQGLVKRLGLADWDKWKPYYELCEVNIVKVDRENLYVVVKGGLWRNENIINKLGNAGVINMNHRRWIIDPRPFDLFVKRFENVLLSMGTPELSLSQPLSPDTIAHIRSGRPKIQSNNAIDCFLWDAQNLSQEKRGIGSLPDKGILESIEYKLTDRQRKAIELAIDHRLTVLWGPPGTGKSRTAIGLVIAEIERAKKHGEAVRILLTGPTWVAVENLLRKLPSLFAKTGWADVGFVRLATETNVANVHSELLENVINISKYNDERYEQLRESLLSKKGVTVVGATSQMVYRLVERCASEEGAYLAPLFDYVILDEASQMDVSGAIMALSAVDEGAALTVIGDDKQMPPIHQATPPAGLEDMVGAVYSFYTSRHKISPIMLNRNFRSNQKIVQFALQAGYNSDLEAEYKDLRMAFSVDVPKKAPTYWSKSLPWSSRYQDILDPDKPLVCYVYDDGISAQSNEFEAQTTASLIRLLYGSLQTTLENGPGDAVNAPHGPETFFKAGVGVVTPHRAQQSRIISYLDQVMPEELSRSDLRHSVDTVERFQGQERQVMIVSFALGDPDAIRLEEDFLYSLRRFNVAISRAQAKVILLVSREVVDHLPTELDTLREARLLKRFAEGYLPNVEELELPFINDGVTSKRNGLLQYESFDD